MFLNTCHKNFRKMLLLLVICCTPVSNCYKVSKENWFYAKKTWHEQFAVAEIYLFCINTLWQTRSAHWMYLSKISLFPMRFTSAQSDRNGSKYIIIKHWIWSFILIDLGVLLYIIKNGNKKSYIKHDFWRQWRGSYNALHHPARWNGGIESSLQCFPFAENCLRDSRRMQIIYKDCHVTVAWQRGTRNFSVKFWGVPGLFIQIVYNAHERTGGKVTMNPSGN